MKMDELTPGTELDEYSADVFGEELTYEQFAALADGTLIILCTLYQDEEPETTDDLDATVCAKMPEVKQDDGQICIPCDDGSCIPYKIRRDKMEIPDRSNKAYYRIYLVKQEEPEMIVTEQGTPPADANLAVTEQYTTAYNLNVKIHTSMQAIQQNLYDMCSALKQMRDGKLYRELGYQNFEEYCQQEAGISRRHAYRYIAIIEKLPSDFVSPGSQIGEHKLYLLTALTDDQREELAQTVDLESTTVRELKAQIAALQSQNADTEKARIDAEKRAQKWYDEAESKGRQLTENHAKLVKSEERNGRLQEQIDELENRPVEVAVPEPSHELQNMQDAMRRINLEHEQWSAKIQDDHIRHVQEINRQHRAETDALRAEYEEKLAAAQASPTEAPDSKAVFKVYLAAVIDAAKRMMAFLSAHPDAACKAQAEKAFQTMLQEVNNEQTV